MALRSGVHIGRRFRRGGGVVAIFAVIVALVGAFLVFKAKT
jgi:hypothetical protein